VAVHLSEIRDFLAKTERFEFKLKSGDVEADERRRIRFSLEDQFACYTKWSLVYHGVVNGQAKSTISSLPLHPYFYSASPTCPGNEAQNRVKYLSSSKSTHSKDLTLGSLQCS